jgi:heat shock protein HtpX
MCVDNPREGFADMFATHPSIDSRVEALVRNAGGRYPGPLELQEPGDESAADEASQDRSVPAAPDPAAKPTPPSGPWNPTEVLTRGPWGGGGGSER